MTYYVYMLRCEDGSVYTGLTTNVARRLEEHRSGGSKGARYTRYHPPVKVLSVWRCEGRPAASRLELRIKRLPKAVKERLAANGDLAVLRGRIAAEEYEHIVWEEA